MDQVGQLDKGRLVETVIRLCEIESPSGRELAIARAVRAELEGMGLAVTEDDTSLQTGAECGNLIAKLPGPPGARTVLLGAHLDTVPLADAIEVEVADGFLSNRRQAILGADNKAAVAMLLEIARRYATAGPPVGLELLFTTSEENGLRGAKAFDVERLEADFGYVFDHASPIGELIVAAPSHYQVIANFTGRSAHAGIRPEAGRSAIVAATKAVDAMRLGRLDEETTANVGRIEGGTATNVVPAHCRIEAEVRSLDEKKATAKVGEMMDALTWAASSTETDVDTEIEKHFEAYRVSATEPCLLVAEAALRDCGIEPLHVATGGGSDASAFQAKGFRCLNIANGTEANHTPQERVSIQALEKMLGVTLMLLERAAAC